MKKVSNSYLPIIRDIMRKLPGTVEDSCFGTLAFYVSKKLLSRMKEDDETLVVYTPDRDEWTKIDPQTFYITDHYRNFPYVLVSLQKVQKSQLVAILTDAWKNRAGKKLLKEYEVMSGYLC